MRRPRRREDLALVFKVRPLHGGRDRRASASSTLCSTSTLTPILGEPAWAPRPTAGALKVSMPGAGLLADLLRTHRAFP